MNSTAPFDSVYIRDHFGDGGEPHKSGLVWVSPDIIPYQKDKLEYPEAERTYDGPDIGKSVLIGRQNDIFIRARNRSKTATRRASVQAFAVESTLVLDITNWEALYTIHGEHKPALFGAKDAKLEPTKIAFLYEPFLLEPPPAGHHCIIAIVHPDDVQIVIPKKFESHAQLIQWLQDNPTVACRNLVKEKAPEKTFIESCAFGNLNDKEAEMLFRLTFTDAPVGAALTLESKDARCPFEYKAEISQPDATITLPNKGSQRVPPKFMSKVTMRIESKYKLPKFRFDLGYYQKVGPSIAGDPEYALYQELAQEVLLDSTTGRTETALHVGQVTYEING